MGPQFPGGLDNIELDKVCLMQAKLHRYLRTTIDNFPEHEDLRVQQFAHGQSNPTYLIQVTLNLLVIKNKTYHALLKALISVIDYE